MRKTQWTLGVVIFAGIAAVSPSRADYEYPWCIQDAEYGYPGDCAYQTREQCLRSVSGRKGYCGPNPRFQLNAPPRPPVSRSRRAPSG